MILIIRRITKGLNLVRSQDTIALALKKPNNESFERVQFVFKHDRCMKLKGKNNMNQFLKLVYSNIAACQITSRKNENKIAQSVTIEMKNIALTQRGDNEA